AGGGAGAGGRGGGLVRAVPGPGRASVGRGRPSEERRAAYAALGGATLTRCAVNRAGIATLGQLLLAVPVVAPLPLAVRYPMLAWRIGWLALLLVPLVPADWHGGWPWGAGQILALLGAFCLAGVRQWRPELWWILKLSLIPCWLWVTAVMPKFNGPAGALLVLYSTASAAYRGVSHP